MERFYFTIVSSALVLVFSVTLMLSFAAMAHGAEAGEIHVTPDGTVKVKGAVIFQTAGSNFYTRVYWREVFLRIVVVTSASTKITKHYGEAATVADIKEGDIVDFTGTFPSSSESFIVNATTLVDRSLEKESLEVRGTVLVPFPDSDRFTMRTSRGTEITVEASAASMKKGIIPIGTAKLVAGDKVTSAKGIYDFSTKTLAAADIRIFQTPSAFVPHNFQGKVVSIEGTSVPTTMRVALISKEYTVKIAPTTKLLSKSGKAIALARFLVGDTVRFYGAVRNDDLTVVDNVEILRNLSL